LASVTGLDFLFHWGGGRSRQGRGPGAEDRNVSMTLIDLLSEDRVAMSAGSGSFTGERDRFAIGGSGPTPDSPAGAR